MEEGDDESDDESGGEWLNKAISNGRARTGKDVLVEACEESESDEESEESDEESGKEGPYEEFGEEATLTRGNLDKSFGPVEKRAQTDEQEGKGSRLQNGAEAKAKRDGDQRTSSKCLPSAICPHSPVEREGWTRVSRASERTHGLIYKITNRKNGKGYVGLSLMAFKKRMQGHKSKALSAGKMVTGCRALNAAIRKHGWESFRKEVILPNVPRAGLPHWEQRMIATHGTLAPKGYNLTPGGETSPMLNPEVQKRAKEVMQSAAVVAKRQKAFSSPSFLAKVSKESKAAWDGYTVEDRNARAQHMAAAARRGWVEKREAKMADMIPRKAKVYWQGLKNRGLERARRHLRQNPERFVGRNPVAEVEEWWGPSFEERRKE